MSVDVMSVRLHLRGVRVTEVVVDTPSELVVGVVSVRKLSGGCRTIPFPRCDWS